MNVNGQLRSLVYGRPISVHVDPIEKKPFFHYLPGSDAFSFATAGCPLRCKFCQNWEISQSRPEDFSARFVPAADMVRAASSRQSPIIAFTYNEPTVFMEYLSDTAKLARQMKLRCVLVSCGFMKPEPLGEMCRLLDAIKIDLKGYSPDFYRDVCGAELQPVLDTIRQIAKSKVHLEIVNLVVPTLNDSEKLLGSLVEWIAGEVGPDVPVHFTRFHPDYQLLNLPPTPVATLERARDLAMSRGLRYVYVGNVPDHPGNHTYCPQCGKAVITRSAFFIAELNVVKGNCRFCGKAIQGVWS
jgi:pyruvate formate lyase activating enzyme